MTSVEAELATQGPLQFSIPRPFPQGELGDADLHGGQQYIPLMDVNIP